MLISFSPSTLEDLGGDARMAAHPGADDRDLADPLVGLDADLGVARARDRLDRAVEVVALDREREVGAAVVGDRLVLDDHVDVDVGVGERAEDPAGDAGLVAARR